MLLQTGWKLSQNLLYCKCNACTLVFNDSGSFKLLYLLRLHCSSEKLLFDARGAVLQIKKWGHFSGHCDFQWFELPDAPV